MLLELEFSEVPVLTIPLFKDWNRGLLMFVIQSIVSLITQVSIFLFKK